MTKDEAAQRAVELNRDHLERAAYRWLAREGDDGWHVVRVSIPGDAARDALKEGVEAKPKPEAPDPRPAFFRDVGGPYAGG
jgi:hypothetical protein